MFLEVMINKVKLLFNEIYQRFKQIIETNESLGNLFTEIHTVFAKTTSNWFNRNFRLKKNILSTYSLML